jgi:hypothetical protein
VGRLGFDALGEGNRKKRRPKVEVLLLREGRGRREEGKKKKKRLEGTEGGLESRGRVV